MMFSSDTSAQVSSRSEASLGQQIQQKSRQDSPDKIYGNAESDDNHYLKEHFHENAAVDEMDSAGLGDTLMIGSISKVFEKDNNLSRRVHELFESDESLDEVMTEDTKKKNMHHHQPLAHNDSTMLSFHKLIPDEASMMDTNNAAVDSIINYSGELNVDASRIFTRLKPIGIGEATPYKPLHKNIDVKKPSFQATNESFDRFFKPSACADIKEFSFGNVSIPSLNNTEYGDLPNFIDLSNASNQQNSMTREDIHNNVAESSTTDDYEFNKKTSLLVNSNAMSVTDVKNTNLSGDVGGTESSIFDYKYFDQFIADNHKTMKIDKEVKKLVYEANEFSKIVQENNEELKFDVNRDEKLKPNGSGGENSVENLENFLSNNTNKLADKKTTTNKTKTEENAIFNHIYNRPRLDDDTLKILDPLQNEETSNFNISQALSNDSLAIQVKHLLDVTDSDGSFENHKLLRDQIDLEKNKSLNYSNVLNEFENTELWDYVQKFLPSKNPQNESWLNNVEGTGDASPDPKKNFFTQVLSPTKSLTKSPTKSPTHEHQPKKSPSSPVKRSFHTPSTSMDKNALRKSYSCDQNISKSTSTGQKDYSKISDWSEQKSSISLDFDGYIRKTCEKYLKEQKRVNSPEKSDGPSVYSVLAPNRFLSQQQVSATTDYQYKDGNLSKISEEKNEGEEVRCTVPKKIDDHSTILSGETRKILDNLIDVEDSLRRSLGKSYQYRQVFGSTSAQTFVKAPKSDEPISESLPKVDCLKEFRSSPAIPPTTITTTATSNNKQVDDNLLNPHQINPHAGGDADDENKQETNQTQHHQFFPTSQQRIAPQGEDAAAATTKTMTSPTTTGAVDDDSFRKLLSQVELNSHDRRRKKLEGSEAERQKSSSSSRDVATTSTSATSYFDEFFNRKLIHKVVASKKSKSHEDRIGEKIEARRQYNKEGKKLPTYDEMLEKLSHATTTSHEEEEEEPVAAPPLQPTTADDVMPDDAVAVVEVKEDRNRSVETVEKCVGTEDLPATTTAATSTTTINKQENLFQQIFIAPSQLTVTSSAAGDTNPEKKTSSAMLPNKIPPPPPPPAAAVSVAQSVASMMVQCDERSIPASPESKKPQQQRPQVVATASHRSNSAMLPWLPDSLDQFKSLDDRSQTNMVKGILKIFDQYDPPSSLQRQQQQRAPREARPEMDSYLAARRAHRGGTSSKMLDPSTTQQTVQRLLSKIERQRESHGGVKSKKEFASRKFDEEESSEEGIFVKSRKSSAHNEKSYYVKLSNKEMQEFFEKKKSSNLTRKQEAKNNANIQKKTKSYGNGGGGRVFHTSSPIKWDKSLKQMIQEEPELVIQSLKHLLDNNRK